MAAALVPLAIDAVSALAPSLISLIAGLVHKRAPIAEATYGASTGPVKLADVFAATMTALQNAAAAGQIPKQLPSDDAVKAIIQAVVSSMKLAGLLEPPTLSSALTVGQSGQVTLRAGQSVTITVA